MSQTPGLSAAGWLFLLLAWGGIVGVTAYCYYRLLKTRNRQR